MRLYVAVVLLVLIAPVAAQQKPGPPSQKPAAGGKGVIRGVVLAADTGRPIFRAEVRIQSSGITPPESRSVLTDEKGRYEATALQAARYAVSAAKPGYMPLAYGQLRPLEPGRPLQLAEGAVLDKVDLTLPRASVIVARVTDQFGDPVRGVAVGAFVPRYMEGRRQLFTAGGNSSLTDDRGETRIFGLPPGEYYVLATPDFRTTWRGEIQTLYPGTLDLPEAQRVRIGIGDEAFVTFPILRSQPSTLSGRIIGSDGAPLAAPYVSLQQIRLGGSGSSRRMNVAPDGTFHEANLPPGDWMIVVNEPEYGTATARLIGDDVQGLIITTRKAAAVRGRVTFEGAPPPASPVDIAIAFDGPRTLVSGAGFVRSGGGVGSIQVTPENEWMFEAQVSGAGVIRTRTNAWILKAVLLDGKDVTDTVLDFGTEYAGKPVEVVLTQRRAALTGTVSNDRGQPVTDYVAVLFPADESQWRPASRFFGAGRPDQEGRFTINGLPAGRYLLTAVEYLDPGEAANPETLTRLRATATAVELSEGEARTIAVRISR